MGEITLLEVVELAQHNHLYRSRLWRALDEWKGLIAKQEGTISDLIEVPVISPISCQYSEFFIA